MSTSWTRKQQDEEYAKIDAMSEGELDTLLDKIQSTFTTDRFKEICKERLDDLQNPAD